MLKWYTMNILKSYEKDLKNEIEKIENKDDVNIIDKLATMLYKYL